MYRREGYGIRKTMGLEKGVHGIDGYLTIQSGRAYLFQHLCFENNSALQKEKKKKKKHNISFLFTN